MYDKLAKLLVKSALKLAAPVLGSVVADAGGEIAGIVIDKHSKEVADAVQQRLLSRINEQLKELGAKEGLDDAQMAPIETTIAAIFDSETTIASAWTEAGFNAHRAAEQVWKSAAKLRVGLSEDEQQYCRIAVEAVFGAIRDERKIVDATEAEFRRLTLERLDQIAAAPARLEDANRVLEAAMLALPVQAYHLGLSPPGALLRADIERPVPFHGRSTELDDLTAWSGDDAQLAVRLITGAGGMGKTRLVLELCRKLQRQGWRAGFLDMRADTEDRGPWLRLTGGTSPLLVVIDYAENRRTQIGILIRAALVNLGKNPIRIVLLARAADDWWDAIRRERDGVGDVLVGPGTSRTALRALAIAGPARTESYNLAALHFSTVLNKPIVGDSPDFTDKSFDRALLLHMAALSAVEGVQIKGEQGILGHALDRERRFWEQRSASLGLPAMYEKAILQAMAVLTLSRGAADKRSATELISRLPLLSGEKASLVGTIVDLLHETYQGERWIDPVLPDLLGEHLVQVALEDNEAGIFDVVFGEKG